MLMKKEFTKVKEYVQNIPSVKYKVDITCEGCGADIKSEITGIALTIFTSLPALKAETVERFAPIRI